MMLDTDTLYITTIIGRASFLVVFIAILPSQLSERYLSHWAIALTTSTLGLTMMVFHPVAASHPLSTLVLLLVLSSLMFSWSGLRLFYRRRLVTWKLLTAIMVLGALFFSLQRLGLPTRRLLAIQFLMASLASLPVVVEIAASPCRRLMAQYVIALAFLLYFLSLSVPAFLLFFDLAATNALNSGRLVMLFDQVAGTLIYFGYIAMAAERASIELKHQAETDPLTGLANRRGVLYAQRKFQDSLALDRPSSVMIADLDHFKTINDCHGHRMGDAVLITLAGRLDSVTRENDLAVRWGGEEFLLILPDTNIEKATTLAERLRGLVADVPFDIDTLSLRATISIGVAATQTGERDFEAAIRRADKALYRAKNEGRNRVCYNPATPVAGNPPGAAGGRSLSGPATPSGGAAEHKT